MCSAPPFITVIITNKRDARIKPLVDRFLCKRPLCCAMIEMTWGGGGLFIFFLLLPLPFFSRQPRFFTHSHLISRRPLLRGATWMYRLLRKKEAGNQARLRFRALPSGRVLQAL